MKLLAFQVGSEVSLNELSRSLEISKETVARYLDLLEKSFVLFRLTGFSRNLRREVTKSQKVFFYDLGVRNAVMDNFRPLSERNDVGALWENFLISERHKRNLYLEKAKKGYFWRTYDGAEIDYLEEGGGKLCGFEMKWGKARPRAPQTFLSEYENSSWELINQESWLEFVK